MSPIVHKPAVLALKYDPNNAVEHPIGVKPKGNMFLADSLDEILLFRASSLGVFSKLSEELLLGEVLTFCNAADFVKLSEVSNYVRAISFHNDLWKELVLRGSHQGRIIFKDSWRDTYIATNAQDSTLSIKKVRLSEPISPIRVRNVYSDVLFETYRLSGLEPTGTWMAKDNVDRVDYRSLSRDKFINEYEKKNKPCIITGFIEESWKDLKEKLGTMEALLSTFPKEVAMECGSVTLSMPEFQEYINSQLSKLDESPIFVFDTKTFSSFPVEPQIPAFENADLFDLLEGTEYRPDNKWLLVGGPGASSKWHVDPNATNAWNAVLCGEKKWILVPPHLGPPPGVEVSGDGFAVRQPLSLTEWLESGFYSDLKDTSSNGTVECTCKAGEIMFVPRGWWHCVRNTGSGLTVAITQNYAAQSSVHQVRRFLREMSHCVSGIPTQLRGSLWKHFDHVLAERLPELLADDNSLIDCEEKNNGELPEKCLDSDNESCCGGEATEFSFWGHFASKGGNKCLSFQR